MFVFCSFALLRLWPELGQGAAVPQPVSLRAASLLPLYFNVVTSRCGAPLFRRVSLFVSLHFVGGRRVAGVFCMIYLGFLTGFSLLGRGLCVGFVLCIREWGLFECSAYVTTLGYLFTALLPRAGGLSTMPGVRHLAFPFPFLPCLSSPGSVCLPPASAWWMA